MYLSIHYLTDLSPLKNRDASDETESCPLNELCLDSQFMCTNGHCIAIGKYCDFIDDCGDGSDEVNCIRRQCKKNSEFKCNNDQCIPIARRCDLLVSGRLFVCFMTLILPLFHLTTTQQDCNDGSDEGLSCTGGKCNLNSTFQCYFGTCIPLYTLCDKHRDCPGKFFEDESDSVCSTILDLETGANAAASSSSTGSVSSGESAFDQMRSPLRSTFTSQPTQSRFFRMRRHADSQEDDESVTLSNYIARQMLEEEKIRRIREATYLPVASSLSCDKNRRRRTCQDLLQYSGISTDGYYELQPSSLNQLTMSAYCRFLNATHAMTIMNHDTEDRLYVRSSADGPGSYVRSITYESSLDLIVSLIDHSAHCRQELSYECSGSGFYFNSTTPNSWWMSRTGAREYNWGGHTAKACACYPNCSSPELLCNCDSGLRFNWTRDYGFVKDRSKLPIRQIAFGDVSRIGQLGFVQVGELECIGNAELSACESLPKTAVRTTSKKQSPEPPKKFQCHSGQIINAESICIYEFDQLGYQIGCRDVSHLRNCGHFDCPPDYVKCLDSYCIPHRYMCNGKWDCVGGSDEIGCSRFTCPGKYKCANESSCILIHQLCDNFRHCPLGDDEWFCNLTCPDSCVCTGMFVNCRDSNISESALARIPKETRKLDLSGNFLGPDLHTIDFSPFADLGELILQNNHIEMVRSRKFIQLTNLYKLDLRHNRIMVIEAGAFAGLRQVTSLMLEYNPTLTEIHSGAFVGLISLRKLNISNTRLGKIERNLFLQMSSLQVLNLVDNQVNSVEKGAFNDLSSLTSLDLRGNPITYFPKDMFSQLKSLRYLSTDSFKFCCLASGVVPFNRCLPPQDEISDCEDLMSNTVQRLILWVLGFVAFFGNLLVVIWRFKTRNQTNRVSSTLILSLGCSDFLMGIYLLIIASVDEYYRGSYIEHSDYWKTSYLCTLCGFLSTISSEMSVATLVFITLDRLISISFSFSSYRFTLKFTKRLDYTFILGLLKDDFLCSLLSRLLVITWVAMFLVSALPLLPLNYFKGQFYSRSGVCLALHLTTRHHPGWEYSVALFLFANLLAFLFIAFCYVYMYKTITSSTKKMKTIMSQKQDRETRIGRQMLFIVVSNFLCWFPVIMMGFMALAGITIPGGAYSWTAVVVLPLNSATDPLIYTLVQFIQNFIANRQQDRQMLLATAGGSARSGRGALFRLAHSTNLNGAGHVSSAKFLRGFSKLSNDLMAESSITSANGYGNSNLLLRSNSTVQSNALLLRPPSGYQSLGEFIRTRNDITTRDLLEICHSVSANLKEFHDMGFALATIGFDNIFVTKQPVAIKEQPTATIAAVSGTTENEIHSKTPVSNGEESEPDHRLQTYIPGVGFAYKVAHSEDVDDYAVNVEEFGLVVKRMLQHYHARQMQRQASTHSVAANSNRQTTETKNATGEPEEATGTGGNSEKK